jgi:hypothetical protein
MEKPKVVTDCNSVMGGTNLSDANLTSYQSTRKRLKRYSRASKDDCTSLSLLQCCHSVTVKSMSALVLRAKKRDNVVKQGTTAKTVGWAPCAAAFPTSLYVCRLLQA